MRAAGRAAATGFALAAAVESASRALWGRSAIASFFEVGILWSGMRMDEDACRAHLEKVAAEPEHPRTPPISFRSPCEIIDVDGTPVHVLNPDSTSNTVVLYLHGGGFAHSLSVAHVLFLNALARRTRATIAVPLYPLAPLHDSRDGLASARACWERLIAGRPGARSVLMGDSAGGNLALVLALDLAESHEAQPDELVLISPLVDATLSDPRIEDLAAVDPMLDPTGLTVFIDSWAGETPLDDRHLPPINADRAAFATLPPVTTFAGTRECLLPDAERLHARLCGAGIVSTLRIGRGLNHVYPLIPSPESFAAGREIARIVRGS